MSDSSNVRLGVRQHLAKRGIFHTDRDCHYVERGTMRELDERDIERYDLEECHYCRTGEVRGGYTGTRPGTVLSDMDPDDIGR